MYSFINDFDEMRMRKLHIYYTFPEYLDTDTAQEGFDTGAYYYQMFFIDSVEINNAVAKISLSSPLEFFDVRLPRNKYYKNHCRHIYKGSRCKYSGSLTKCDYTLEDCKAHNNATNFGGFPSTGKPYYY
jgi:phage-related protein